MEVALLLHNVRSAHNVGSIFRTADAAGVSRIYLSGYTPRPVDRFGRAQKEIAKTALGAEGYIPWEYAESPSLFIERLRKKHWSIVGIEQDGRAHDYRSCKLKNPTLCIVGNEVRGMSRALRAQCDRLIEIPMRGRMVRHAHHPRHSGRGKESLNVSVAAGIILFSCIS
ncbi:RNA methyltransferase [Candidatus Kaiserbacteria bacterium CG10_big_fil_rev_8_21_14_0_10_51_14]|uniref:RNA methyltransferase n=1 Tax=Candidatus Kaiserbacteria bacterium CG10_big_fil_rev_8_21_14_0_10_51_14 TaxID=1974610 RepID=A0A2H0UEQ2_9BACT|nr:MAG: RNA methyltransferase [Candidatus Kaiserbacteria bacterium CG10_big_fil_rev_8_21_14_0_10_51_14]